MSGEQQVDRFSVRLANGQEFGPAEMHIIVQWARENRVPRDASLVPERGGVATPVMSRPEVAAVLSAPPAVARPAPAAPQSDATGGIIPYKNPLALIGYYVSVGSLIPILALIAGPAAVVLGVLGLRYRAKNPTARGAAHAWVAIILGSITFLANVALIVGAMNL